MKKHTDASRWQILGEIELPVGSADHDRIQAWLMETLKPLELHATLLNKILNSAQEAAAHAVQAGAVMKFEHIHFLVFAPANQTSKGQTWGFFRIEKIERTQQSITSPDHAVEFYLYREG